MFIYQLISSLWKSNDLGTLMSGSGIPELENRVKKLTYGLLHQKTELSQIVT